MRSPLSPKPAPRPSQRRPAARLVKARSFGWASMIFSVSADARRDAKRPARQFVVHAADVLREIGETDPEPRQHAIFVRAQEPRRQPDAVQRPPELVLRMRIIGAALRRHGPRRRAAEDDLQARLEDVGQDRICVQFGPALLARTSPASDLGTAHMCMTHVCGRGSQIRSSGCRRRPRGFRATLRRPRGTSRACALPTSDFRRPLPARACWRTRAPGPRCRPRP